jgi:quinoprotein glucose dehydrogenase
VILALLLLAQEPDAEQALKKLRVAPGLKATLFAAEPQLVNPVAFWIDPKGRHYVVETHRIASSVYDIRGYMGWLDDDLACRTVEDRSAMYRRRLGTDAAKLAVESERVRLLEDLDGDGRADRAGTFAEGFNSDVDGLAAGVVGRKGDVWLANIPSLWLLRDADGDGRAESRRALHSGFGVRMGYIGHDLHGPVFGPDGRLYFSIGDRGLHVSPAVSNPDSGAVLRCNPDGSGLELVATGLRNPQELAFDDQGNLFTWDNNSDWHDMARWVHVVEGLDAGWRIGYQFLPGRGPWEAEKIWEAGADVPYRLPPLANIDHGPSGIAYYPGTGLPERYDGKFLCCNFPGGINAWGVKPKGASFEVVDRSEFLWNVWATDVQFGPDGAVYVSDWGEGWSKKGVGRIYRITDPSLADDPAVLEVRRLLSEGMEKRTSADLSALLGHRDQRVRQAAQFELADRGVESVRVLSETVGQSNRQLPRLHALWALGQIGALEPVEAALRNPDAEVRAQACRVLGDRRRAPPADLLDDPHPRVRFQAALAFARAGRKEAGVVELLRKNDDRDAYVRHAGVMALGAFEPAELERLAQDPSRAVRLGALLALRRRVRPEIRVFLKDRELALEAARAIYDVPVDGAMADLGALLDDPNCPDALLPRVIEANARLGTDKAAGALSWFARRHDFPRAARAQALRALAEWDQPPGRDRIVGLWRPYPSTDPEAGKRWVRPLIEGLLRDGGEAVQLEALRFPRWEETAAVLAQLAGDPRTASSVRVRALRAHPAAAAGLLEDRDLRVRAEAVRLAPAAGVSDARLEALALSDAPAPVRQAAVLGLRDRAAFERVAKAAPPDLRIEVEEAARRLGIAFEESKDALVEGGDPVLGRAVYGRADASCVRCHKLKDGGGTVGPPLTNVAARLPRAKILEALLDPNAEIAKGFEQVLVQLVSGDVRAGRLERETDRELVLVDPENRLETIPKDRIQARKPGKSAMPEDLGKKLARRDVRDLVAFLATLRGAEPKAHPGAVVVDNEDPAGFRTEGNWRTEHSGGDYGARVHWANPDATGRTKAVWTAKLKPGRYRVSVWVGPDPLGDHAPDAPFTVGDSKVRVDFAKDTLAWKPLGVFEFGAEAAVTLSSDAGGILYADAVQFVPE